MKYCEGDDNGDVMGVVTLDLVVGVVIFTGVVVGAGTVGVDAVGVDTVGVGIIGADIIGVGIARDDVVDGEDGVEFTGVTGVVIGVVVGVVDGFGVCTIGDTIATKAEGRFETCACGPACAWGAVNCV